MEEGNISRYSKVDVMKPLLNGCMTGQLHGLYKYCHHSILENVAPSDVPNISKKKLPLALFNKTLLKKELLRGVISKTASLGTFEILTQRLRNVNNKGQPVSLYQEACCGLISGATTIFVCQPFSVAYDRVGLKNFTYTNLFGTIHRIVRNERASNLWVGSRAVMATSIAAYAGMLASYDRSKAYLIQTQGLSKWKAQLSASIISGFFCTACAHPFIFLSAIQEAVEEDRKKGAKRVYRNIPAYMCQILNPYSSSFNFYAN